MTKYRGTNNGRANEMASTITTGESSHHTRKRRLERRIACSEETMRLGKKAPTQASAYAKTRIAPPFPESCNASRHRSLSPGRGIQRSGPAPVAAMKRKTGELKQAIHAQSRRCCLGP